MMPQNSRQEKEQTIFELAQKVQEIKQEKERLDQEYKLLREEIIGLMQELEVSKLRGDTFEVKYNLPHSFDIALFKLEHPELAKQFVKEVTNIKVEDELVKKNLLAEKYPELFEKYNMPLTPRLTIS